MVASNGATLTSMTSSTFFLVLSAYSVQAARLPRVSLQR